MRTAITQDLLRKLPAGPCDIRDTKMPGLVLRVRASGAATWSIVFRRGKRETLGKLEALTLPEARDLAKTILGDVARGKDPAAERRKRKSGTLKQFVETHYTPWVTAHRKTGDETIARVYAVFDGLLNKPLGELSAFTFESWRTGRRQSGISDATINRDFNAIRAVLSKAVEWGVLGTHPMKGVKPKKEDRIGRLRYLSADEEQRLRQTLIDRDEARRDGRRRFNAWRSERGYQTLPELSPDLYPDHLHPIVLLALNTGLRRGELLGLTWADVNWTSRLLAVRGVTAKSGLTRYVPLNEEAVKVLRAWPFQIGKGYVFPGPTGERMESLKTAWLKIATAAKLDDFTFHDLRHTFASKLVMAGVGLNTVRELLGHSDLKMTLRYAHLAPEHKAAAVAKLVSA
jgi:integrase